jgi:polar amino acid transport system permease protein
MALLAEAGLPDRILLEDRAVVPDHGWQIVWARRTLLLLVGAAFAGHFALTLISNPAMRWDSIFKYLTAPLIIEGIAVTILMTIGAAIIGLIGGLIIALARMSSNPAAKAAAIAYLSFFRGVPLLVQILFWYNLGTFFPRLGLYIPFTDIGISGDTNQLLSPLTASLIAIGLNQAAYMGEIIRGGVLSVPHGQIEAAYGLGMTKPRAFLRVIAPLAAKSIVPPLGNDMINLLKATSLVSIVGVGDLMTRTQGIYASNYQVIPLLIVASIWYLILTAVITIFQAVLENVVSAGQHADAKPLLSRWRAQLFPAQGGLLS